MKSRQPSGVCRLNRSNPFYNDIAFSHVFNMGKWSQDLKSGELTVHVDDGTAMASDFAGGHCRETTAAANKIQLVADSTSVISATECTILFDHEKTDASNRAWGFGVETATVSARRCGGHMPWSDGTIYFDFGGQADGTSRLVVTSQSFEYAHWALTVGPRGMEIFKNGSIVGSHGNRGTRTGLIAADPFNWGHGNNTSTTDFFKTGHVTFYNKQLPVDLIKDHAKYPYWHVQPIKRKRYFLPAAAASSGVFDVFNAGIIGVA